MPRGYRPLTLDQRIRNREAQLRKEEEERQKQQQGPQPSVGVMDVVKEVPGAFAKIGKGAFNMFTRSTQEFGNTIGNTIALPQQQRELEEMENIKQNQLAQIVDQIKRNRQAGRDTTRLMEAYRQRSGELPDIYDINDAIGKSNKQVLGEAAGTLLEATALGKFGGAGARSFTMARNTTPTLIAGGAKAITRAAAAKAAAKGVAIGAGQGYLYDVSSDLKGNKSWQDILKPGMGTAIGAAIPAVIGGIGLTRTEAALQIDDLTKKGFSKDEARKIVSEGGYMRLFENPKMRELGDKINELNEKMVNAPNKVLYNRYKKAYEQAFEAYKRESQAGFIKNPFAKFTDDGFEVDKYDDETKKLLGLGDDGKPKPGTKSDVPDFPEFGPDGPPPGMKKGSLADEAAKLEKAKGLLKRPQHQIDIENALNNNDRAKALRILNKIDDNDPYKHSMREFLEDNPTVKGKTAVTTAKEIGEQAASGSPNPQPIPKDVSAYYNVDRLKINDQGKQAIKDEIQKNGARLEQVVGKRLKHKEILDLAQESSEVLNKTVTREETAAKIAANLNLRREIAKTAMTGKIKDPKAFMDAWLKDKSIGEDIARQLEARKINADPKETRAIKAVLDSIYKQNKNTDEIAKAMEGVDFNDPKQMAEFYRKFVKANATEWIDALRYNSMLSSPTTHFVNISSNFQGTGILTPIEKTVTGMVDATRSALTGKPRQYAIGEGAAYAKGYYRNIATAAKRFISVMKGTKTFEYNPDLPVTSQMDLATSKGGRIVEKTLKYPTRLLEATDQFFSAMTEGGVESSLAYRASKGIGSADDVAQEAAKRLFRGELHSAEQGYVLNAIDDVTGAISRLRHSDNPVTSTIAKFTLPFIRTPTNLLKQGIEYSPMGLMTLPGAQNKTQQISKLIIGTASAAGAATLLGQDRLTWGEPINAKQKAAFRAAGRQPYSIKIGNKWVSYSKLHPAFAFNFALIAAIDDAKKNQRLDDSEADNILGAFSKFGSFIADQSYLKNIGDFVGSVRGDAGGWSKLVGNYPQQLIPFRALMGYVERFVDPNQRQADPDGTFLEKQMQQITGQIPWLAEQDIYVGGKRLTPIERRNQFDQPIKNSERAWNLISPNRITDVDPTHEGLWKLNEFDSKMRRLDSDIDERIEKAIRKKMLQAR